VGDSVSPPKAAGGEWDADALAALAGLGRINAVAADTLVLWLGST
jgi:hypothetical protein